MTRARWGIVVLGLLLVVGVIARYVATSGPSESPTATSVVAARLIADGIVAPVSQARVGTVGGGVLLGLNVAIGDSVEARASSRECAVQPMLKC